MEVHSAGERLTGRILEKENREGVRHFVSGQHHAESLEGNGVVLLTWVDQMGHAVAMPCHQVEGTWRPMGSARKAGQSQLFGVIEVPDDYEFSDRQLAAFKAMEDRGDQD